VVDPDHPEGGSPTYLPEQSRVLPVAGLEIEGRYQAADLDVRAGGDFFDVFPLGPERTAVIIGDIAGHGRDAAEAGRSVRALVHRELARAAGPADVLTAVEAELVADGASTMATLLCAEIDTSHLSVIDRWGNVFGATFSDSFIYGPITQELAQKVCTRRISNL